MNDSKHPKHRQRFLHVIGTRLTASRLYGALIYDVCRYYITAIVILELMMRRVVVS